jgi:cysteine desulfurase/selenocysteine lyase
MLDQKINRRPFIYLDNAATGHKPNSVIKKMQEFYAEEYGKPNEDHELGKEATKQVEEVRKKVAKFINSRSEKNIVFTRGCTEAINLVAMAFVRLLKKGDEIILSELEHHSNIIPWQITAEQTGAVIKVIPLTPDGSVDVEVYKGLLSPRTRLVAISQSSHVLGTILPVKKIIQLAHAKAIPVLVDAAQSIPHIPVDVEEMGCDFLTFSGHKMGGPTGVGVLYGKRNWLNRLPVVEGGSDMAKKVSFKKFKPESLPTKFEAGTTAFADIIGLGTAIDFLEKFGMDKLFEIEKELLDYATPKIASIEGLEILGNAAEKQAVISLKLKKNKDVKQLEKYLNDKHNIFVRAGDMNAQPLMDVLHVKKVLRISFSYYNTKEEIDQLVIGLKEFMKKSD